MCLLCISEAKRVSVCKTRGIKKIVLWTLWGLLDTLGNSPGGLDTRISVHTQGRCRWARQNRNLQCPKGFFYWCKQGAKCLPQEPPALARCVQPAHTPEPFGRLSLRSWKSFPEGGGGLRTGSEKLLDPPGSRRSAGVGSGKNPRVRPALYAENKFLAKTCKKETV